MCAMLVIGAFGLTGCVMHALHGADHRHEQDAVMEPSPLQYPKIQAGQEQVGTSAKTTETQNHQAHDRPKKGLWILGIIGMAAMMALMIF